jgi:3-oxoacyl-[acyl-carrier protein] reductase
MSDINTHAVITGGSGDLAQAMVAEWQAASWQVDAPSRAELDVDDPKSAKKYFKERVFKLLVCNAGLTGDTPLVRLQESAWDTSWSVNYGGSLRCAEAVLPMMRQQGGGHIVFISSFSAIHPPIGQVAYAAAKAALLGLVADLAVRHGAANIRVNAILPGFLDTRMTESVSAERRAEVLAHHTLDRFNTCDKVAKFIRFLDQEMLHTSGQVFQLDSRLASW